MELRVLRYFLTIAGEENITRAADILHVTQPTLSRQIMQLEDELGTKLFKRSKYCIKLTEDGLFLKRRAEEILSLAENTTEAIGNKNKDIVGEITIGCTETHSMDALASKMAEFHTLHKGVSYNIYTTNADGIKENIEKGVFELGLVTDPVDTSRFETLHLQRKERWGALVREDDPLSEKEFIYPDDVKDKSLILPVRTEVRYILEGWFGASFQDLNIAARYNLGRNVAVMVRSGLGIGICFDLFSNYEGLRFIPMIPPLMTGSAVCWKKNQLFSTVTRSFIEFLKNTN